MVMFSYSKEQSKAFENELEKLGKRYHLKIEVRDSDESGIISESYVPLGMEQKINLKK